MTSILATSVALRDTLQVICKTSQNWVEIIALIVSASMFLVAWLTFREHNRPYITLHAEVRNGSNVNLVLINSGNRAAYNVSVETDVPLESVFYYKNPKCRTPFVTEKIHHFIGPDQSISNYFDGLSWRYPPRTDDYKKPCDKYNVTIKYRYKIRNFTEKYQLDLSYLEFVPRSDSENHMSSISSSLRSIADRMPGGWIHRIQNMFSMHKGKHKQEDAKDNAGNSTDIEDNSHESK